MTVLDALVMLLNGLAAGGLLFMLGAGLTLILSLMGVLNFAHGALYMLGAYLGGALAQALGFWPALALAPLAVGGLGWVFERTVLQRVQAGGHGAELLVTFGLGLLITEGVQLVWGRGPLPLVPPPAWLQGPAFTLVVAEATGWHGLAGAAPAGLCTSAGVGVNVALGAAVQCAGFPASRVLILGTALVMGGVLFFLWRFTRVGLVVQAALTHPHTVQALGHDLPRLRRAVFAAGCALAGLAGVVAAQAFVVEPGMAAATGALLFVVVVVGGLGSLGGALLAALLVGALQTWPLAWDVSIADGLRRMGWSPGPQSPGWPLWRLTLAQAAPMLPYALLVAVLVWRPQGIAGRDAA